MVTRPLRLAMIAAFPVLPPVAGGKVRIVQLARSLSRLGVDVTVIAPYHVTQTKKLAEREPFRLLEAVYPPGVIPFLLVDRPFPYGVLISFHPGYGLTLPASLDAFDVVQFEHPAFVDLTRRVPAGVPVVYGSQNVELDYVTAECRPGLVRRLAGARIHDLESRIVERARHVFACTDADRRRFGELYSVPLDRITVVPNGVDLAAIDASLAGERRPALENGAGRRRAVFAGSDVKHNREAAGAILEDVAPRLEADVDFVFVGSCARRLVGSHGPNVIVDPRRELAHYATPGAVGLNPVSSGSGSNLKLPYYLAHGLTAISTPFGVRGFEDLLPWVKVAELEDFAEALAGSLPACDGVRETLSRYEWDAIAAEALHVYERLAAGADGAQQRARA